MSVAVGFLMIIGPGESDIGLDTLDHVLSLYPECGVWVRDDCTADGTWEKLQEFASKHGSRVKLDKNPCRMGFYGLPSSVFRGFESIYRTEQTIEMVLKIDPDTCVLRVGLIEFARELFAKEGPGIIGSIRTSPSGTKRDHRQHLRRFIRDLLPLGVDRATRHLRFGTPFYLTTLMKAIRNGYHLGEHAQGGLYILHGETLRKLGDDGFWSSIPDEGSRVIKEEDVLVSLGVKSIGHAFIDIHRPPLSRVWIQYKSPIALTAEQIVNRELLAVHPLKKDALELRRAVRPSVPLLDCPTFCTGEKHAAVNDRRREPERF